ncbi:iron complex transport system substrate-binding protein [Leucobacter luti]|uniref:ABC transporter substrate-binding protein n=1 Tax=Leucobacter luti TaxID=340320 RepID=UPI001048F145|nr:ABC transporter substrate-binding protein [Leucobacter luti]MCW2289050.1 iron complex transport system substrate-binding protein [Leucobacter luti]TCK35549.1 iron complex transport system substrate-binding protein [Leucobacter luti]
MFPRSRKPSIAFAAALLGASLLFTGCSAATAPEAAPSAVAEQTERTVTTEQGEVTVPAVPQRVVVLNYALAGYLYDLDVPVVGTTSEDFDHEPEFSELWGEGPKENNTEFITWGMDGFDLEGVLELEPDLILAGGLGLPNGLAAKSYDQLSQIAPTVIVGKDLATWQDQFAFIADDVLGRSTDFEDRVTAYDDRVAEVKAAIDVPATPASVLTITSDGTPYLLFEDAGLPQELEALGFTAAPLVQEHKLEPYNPGGDMATLSTEQVGQLLADVPTLFITGFNTDTTDVATLAENPVWAGTRAFAEGHAYDLPYWTVRGDYDKALALLDIIEAQFS